MTTPTPDREELWASLVDGTLSPDDFAQLERLLAEDPAARRRYVELMMLDTILAEELATESMGDMVDLLGAPATIPRHAAVGVALPAPVRTTRRWFATAGAAAAGFLICATLWSLYGHGTEASAATLVGETLRVHQLPLDRCYVIEVQRPGAAESSRPGARPRVDRLWTRGDRFFLESSTGQTRWEWGQDSDGRVWMTHGPQTGLTFEANELPPWLATVCDALSMKLEPMLGEVLKNFDLTWGENPGDPGTKVVRAVNTRSMQPRWLKEAWLEIDNESKVLRKLTVVRQVRMRQAVTVSYTLAASESQPDNRYELSGHLTEPFVVYSRTNQPQKRTGILTEHFGTFIARSLLTPLEMEEPAAKK